MPLNTRKLSKPASDTPRTKANREKKAKAKNKDEATFTEKLVKKEHTLATMEEVSALVNKHLCNIKLDPLTDLIAGIGKDDNPVAQVHKTAWNLLRLLLLQAVSRMGSRAPVSARGLPVFPLTDSEVTLYNKLSQTIINSKNALINNRKQKMAEEAMKDDPINITPVQFTKLEVDRLIEIAESNKE